MGFGLLRQMGIRSHGLRGRRVVGDPYAQLRVAFPKIPGDPAAVRLEQPLACPAEAEALIPAARQADLVRLAQESAGRLCYL